ncbi:MAG: sterol desaturase family protein, partial [Erythrobacter sp.]
RHKLAYLLREPGWSHDGERETSDMIRARWQARTGTIASDPERKSIAGLSKSA